MIINIIYVNDKCCLSQMNIKLLSLNEENEISEYTSRRHNNVLRFQKERVLQLEGVLQFGEMW